MAGETEAEIILGEFGVDAYYQVVGGSQPAQPPYLRPTFQYLVAFQDLPTTDPTGFTVAPVGTLGTAGQWTDITRDVMSHRISRGRQHELQQFEAGTCELRLGGTGAWQGNYNPLNTTGPYYTFLTPRKWLQVRTVWNGQTFLRFTGHVDAWPVEWPDPYTQWSTVHASDPFRMFNLNNVTSAGYATQVITDGAFGYWRFGDPVGNTVAVDSSGNGNAGLEVINNLGAVTYTFGGSGALPADPTTSVQIQTDSTNGNAGGFNPASLTSVTGTTGVTWEVWLKFTGAANCEPISHFGFTFSGTSYIMEITVGTNGFAAKDAGTVNVAASGTTPQIDDGNWHHIVVTMTTAWVVNLYLDSVAYGSPHTLSAFNAQTTSPSYLDVENISGAGTPTASFQEWALYPSVLTAAQVLNHFNLATFPQESTDSRIKRILNTIGWSATARSLDPGKSTVQKVTSALTSTSSLSHMQQVEGTEGGALFAGTDGKINFRSRNSLFSNGLFTQSQVTIGDRFQTNDLPFDPGPTIKIDDLDLYNEAVATRSNGNTQRATNSTSITNNGRATWQPPTTLLGTSDSEVLNLCQYIVFKYNTPIVRTQSVTVDLFNLIQPNLVGTLLGLDLLYKISIERVQFAGGGTVFSQAANVEHITEQSSPDQYKITFAVAISDPPFWVLGQSRLGIDTTLSW